MTGADTPALRVLLVDDESLARARLRSLLADCRNPSVCIDGEAANAAQAMDHMRRQSFDVALLDINMPGADGLTLAQAVNSQERPPALIFVTAHAQHALQAFELDAVDYLTKPVRLERLQTALQKAQRHLQVAREAQATADSEEMLVIHERNRVERIALHQVVYFKAELKYITVRTSARSYILDGSLGDLEEKYGDQFIRIHRNALIARRAVHALEKHFDAEEGEGWAVRLHGVDELLSVSRRQLAAVRGIIAAG